MQRVQWNSFKNDRKLFYFTLKAIFVLKVYSHGKRIDKKAKVNFKIYDNTKKSFWEWMSNLRIQKFFLCSKRIRLCGLERDKMFVFSMIINLTCSLDLCRGFWKCLSHGGPSTLHTSFLWVWILEFMLYSNLSIYCCKNFSRELVTNFENCRVKKVNLSFWSLLFRFNCRMVATSVL